MSVRLLEASLENLDAGGVVSPEMLRGDAVVMERLGMLCGVGVLERCGGGLKRSPELDAGPLALFAPLISRFDIRLMPAHLGECPVHFCTGIVKVPPVEGAGGGAGISLPGGGQGVSRARAALGCLGELAERLSLFGQGQGDPRVRSRRSDDADLDLGAFLGFSRQQEQRLAGRFSALAGCAEAGPIDWNLLTDRRVALRRCEKNVRAVVPSLGVLFGEARLFAGLDLGLASSAGCAVWADVDGAVERAVLELVERDAFARAWYNRLGISRVPTDALADFLPISLAEFLTTRDRTTEIFQVASDLPVHVIATISHLGSGLGASIGVAAGRAAGAVMESAVLEMLQGEVSLELMDRSFARGPGVDVPAGDGQTIPSALRYARETSIIDDFRLNAAPMAELASLRRDFPAEVVTRCLAERGIDAWVFEATRDDLKVPCVKVLSRDLCSWEPRFGKRRLYPDGDLSDAELIDLEAAYAARPYPF